MHIGQLRIHEYLLTVIENVHTAERAEPVPDIDIVRIVQVEHAGVAAVIRVATTNRPRVGRIREVRIVTTPGLVVAGNRLSLVSITTVLIIRQF